MGIYDIVRFYDMYRLQRELEKIGESVRDDMFRGNVQYAEIHGYTVIVVLCLDDYNYDDPNVTSEIQSIIDGCVLDSTTHHR